MAMALITPPASFPVSVAKTKEFLKLEHSDDDALIDDLISQAVSYIESRCQLKLITQSWRLYYDNFPQNKLLEIPLSPVQGVEQIQYFDLQGDPKTVNASDYQLDRHARPARLRFNKTICTGDQLNGLEIDLQFGFGLTGIEVPGDIIRALMVTIAHWYEFRGAVNPADQPLSNPGGVDKLLAPYLRVNI